MKTIRILNDVVDVIKPFGSGAFSDGHYFVNYKGTNCVAHKSFNNIVKDYMYDVHYKTMDVSFTSKVIDVKIESGVLCLVFEGGGVYSPIFIRPESIRKQIINDILNEK